MTDVGYPKKCDKIPIDFDCIFSDVDAAVEAAHKAQSEYAKMGGDVRRKVCEAIRRVGRQSGDHLAWVAWSETGRGRFEDKKSKMVTIVDRTPGPEDIQPRAFTGAQGLTLIDYQPYGVLASITPTTNPVATVLNNALTLLSGGNGVVFQPHPAAAKSTCRAAGLIHEAVVKAGGPPNLLVSIYPPTMDTATQLMTHPKIAANLVTGGPAVVKHALASGKKAFCAGPGNPPVLVDETACTMMAAAGIYRGASFDNNMVCSDEKEVFVVESSYDSLLTEFRNLGAHILKPEEIERILPVILKGYPSEQKELPVVPALVGMNVDTLLAMIGVSVPEGCKLAIAPVGKDHPLVHSEQLLPILPVVKVTDWQEGTACAAEAEKGRKHSAALYTKDMFRVSAFGQRVAVSNLVVNGSILAGLGVGGEGYTSFSIAGSTGEGYTTPKSFVRERRMTCVNSMNFAN